MSNTFLSKSKYLRGWQCHKSLYLDKHHPELRDVISEGQEAVFAKGHEVGYYAQQLFPGGILVGRGDFKDIRAFLPALPLRQAGVANTQELIHQNTPVIYEAAFEYDGNINYMDILVKSENGWKAYEVKGSTQLKEYYLQDIAFQYYVMTHSGLKLEDIYLVHINNEYIRKGELDIHALFTIVSVKEQVISMQDEIKENINELKQMLSKSIPAIDIGPYCDDPYTCDFYGHCWKHIPEYSVFDIGNLRTNKKFELYQSGILELIDIPDEYPLNDNQWMQVECEINGESIIDKDNLREFKKQFQYPLYFLDFETFQPAIPIYDNSRPYQQIPFQYSLHIQKIKDGPLEHYEFLGTPPEDPRILFIEILISQIGDKGSIVVYNQGFETARLREIARDFPKSQKQIEAMLERIVDLMVPFQKRWFYTPAMKGSYSIKYVLPAMVQELSYQNLEIKEGGSASLTYESLYEDDDSASVHMKRKNLLEYCKMDTLAMVRVLERI